MPTAVKKKTTGFKVTSGGICCSDPCYAYPSVHVDALNGDWVAKAEKTDEGSWGHRVSKIIVHHKSFSPIGNNYQTETKIIGVDSGQAGVFDANIYNSGSFYDKCCSTTLGKQGYGYVDGGFVSSSGYGDGGYEAVIYKKNNKAVAIEVTFISHEDEA